MTEKVGVQNESSAEWLDVDVLNELLQAEWILREYGYFEQMKQVRGRDRWEGLSPWRQETTASFSVEFRNGKWVWNDFGGRPLINGRPAFGNMVGLIQAFENESNPRKAMLKAAEIIRRYAPSALSEQVPPAVEHKRRSVRQKVVVKEEVVIEPNVPFGKELGGLRFQGLPYFEQYGISEETARLFKAGYCSKGTMRRRIAFPVRNADGVVVYYIGRAAREGVEPKWKVPKKTKTDLELFGIDKVANEPDVHAFMVQHGVVLVEGTGDVMKLHQEGFLGGLAPCGDYLSEHQMILMLAHNPSKKVTLFFDNNEGGIQGRRLAAKMLIHDAFVRVIDYRRVPTGELFENPTDPKHFTGEELELLFSRQLENPVFDGWYNLHTLISDTAVQTVVAEHGVIVVDSPQAITRLSNLGFPNVVSLGEGSVRRDMMQALLTDFNPSGKVTLFFTKEGLAQARAAMGSLLYDGYTRLVDYDLIPESSNGLVPSMAEHFTRDELMIVLMQDPV